MAGMNSQLPSSPDESRRTQERAHSGHDREFEVVRRISQILFQHLEVDELVETTLQSALDEVGAEAGSILLADVQSKQLIFRHSIGSNPVPRGTSIPWDRGIAGAVFRRFLIAAESVRLPGRSPEEAGARTTDVKLQGWNPRSRRTDVERGERHETS